MIKTPEQIRNHFKNRRMTVEYGDALDTVRPILRQIEHEGDAALHRISREIDGHPVEEIPKRVWREAYESLDASLRDALETAKERIEAFYRREPMGGFLEAGPEGVLGQLVRPLDRVGVYVPGGSAPLLSTVLMTVIPAKVAGGGEVVVGSPPRVRAGMLASAWCAGALRLFCVCGGLGRCSVG